MRSSPAAHLADGSAPQTGKILVLGHPVTARQIARSLEAQGYVGLVYADWASERLPEPWEPDAILRFKQLILPIRSTLSGIHPGTTAWAERPELPTVGRELGLTVISPPSRVLSYFINRLTLLAEADRLEIPHLVRAFDPIHSARELERIWTSEADPAVAPRFPIVLKAVRGGDGGFGIFVLRSRDDFRQRLPLWIEQLRKNFGEVMLFTERYVDGARHIVKPFARFANGHFFEFAAVDASLQRRHRKVIEFCPAPSLDDEISKRLGEWSERLADRMGYVGVGTFEFLVDGPRAFFIDGSARLSTGFHLWEQVSGTQAVEWQLASLEAQPKAPKREAPKREASHGIGLRIYAEDSLHQLPQPGLISKAPPSSLVHRPGMVAETEVGVRSGDQVGGDAQSLLALIQVGASDFSQSVQSAVRALSEFWIEGTLQTNERFLRELLQHPWVANGMFHAGFVEEEFIPETAPAEEVIQAALATVTELCPETRQWLIGDRIFSLKQPLKWLSLPERSAHSVSGVLLSTDGKAQTRVMAHRLASPTSEQWRIRVQDWWFKLKRVLLHEARKPHVRPVCALVTGRVHALLYQAGDLAPANQFLIIVESMGLLVPHAVSFPGRLVHWHVTAESSVQEGQVLAEIELHETPETETKGSP